MNKPQYHNGKPINTCFVFTGKLVGIPPLALDIIGVISLCVTGEITRTDKPKA